MFFEFKHGGHALAKGAGGPEAARGRPDITLPEQAGDDFDPDTMTPFRYLTGDVGPEGRLPDRPETVPALDKLGEAIVAQPEPPDTDVDAQDKNPDAESIPPIFTYWSQFIDHELTARTDRNEKVSDITVDDGNLTPADRDTVERDLLNRRTPALELDCLYGDGPPGDYGNKARRARDRNLRLAHKLRDGAKMRIGVAEVVNQGPARPGDPPNENEGQPNGPVPPPTNDLNRDLPRIGALLDLGVVEKDDFPEKLRSSTTFRQRAFIGDPRNDENLIVAQFHLALLRFHNAVVDWLRFKDPRKERRDTEELFEDARKVVRWTFQWLTVNQFLKTLLRPDVVDQVIKDGASLYRKKVEGRHEPYMPVEFSVACYRFGHSMIRNVYDYNRDFGRRSEAGGRGFVGENASLDLLFRFTGKSPLPFFGGSQTLPHNWIIEWDRFDGTLPHDAADGQPARLARKIDTHLAMRLGELSNEGPEADAELTEEQRQRLTVLLKHLARRNLRRGYQLALPTGQAMAHALGVEALAPEKLKEGNSPAVNEAMEQGGFFERTPLWFYILKEAEVSEKGERLGPLGSRVVAETVLGVLLTDPESYLSQDPGWDPSKPTPRAGGPLKLPDGRTITTIHDLLQFAGVAV